MFGVRRSTEKRFLQSLLNIFRGVFEKARHGTAGEIEGSLRGYGLTEKESRALYRAIETMAKTTRKETFRSWREAAVKSSRGKAMYQGLMKEMEGPVGRRFAEIVAENYHYIKTLPWSWAEYVAAYAQRETLKGRRPESIEAELRKIMPERIQRNLKCIVRTECAKANASLVEARAESLGVRAYIWRSANDERTRHAHHMMDGVMVFYDDPPNPEALFGGGKPYGSYHAGNTFNCRCYMEPVVDISMLPDQVRLHYHGKVAFWSKNMIRQRFGKIA